MRLTIAAAACFLAAGIATAQDAPKPADSPAAAAPPAIVITGRRGQEQQVKDFVAALTPSPDGAIPRFVDEVCPAAAGLLPEQNAALAARLRQVAVAIGLKAAPEGCAPNAFVVVVTGSKKAFLEAVQKRHPQTFGMMTARDIRRLAMAPGPAAAWQIAGAVDKKDKAQRYNDIFSGSPSEAWEAVNRARSNPTGFDASILVIEMAPLQGLTTTQAADYAAMRLFAHLDPARLPAPAPPTILTALDAPLGSQVPMTLTRWDAGFLKGLYATRLYARPNSQRADIAREVSQGLGAEPH
jgi:hypothetical protein